MSSYLSFQMSALEKDVPDSGYLIFMWAQQLSVRLSFNQGRITGFLDIDQLRDQIIAV